jgi:hypothetical protein
MSIIRANTLSTNSGSGTLSIPASNILNTVDYDYAIQTVSKTFYDATTTTLARTYVIPTNGTLAITSRLANSLFYVTVTAAMYSQSTNGLNLGISRTVGGVTTRLLGTDGAAGDTWMGGGNATATVGQSYNVERNFLDSPAQPVGTVITYNMLFSVWTTGTAHLNYSTFTLGSTITVMELSP